MTALHSSVPRTLDAESQKYWIRVGRELVFNGLQTAKESARQLVTITSALQGIFFAVVRFTELKSLFGNPKLLWLLFPSVAWLLSLMFSVMVLAPERIRIEELADPVEVSSKIIKASNKKSRFVRIAQWLLITGLAALLVEIGLYFLIAP